MKEADILITRENRDRPDVRAVLDMLPAYTALRAQVAVMNTHYTGPPSQTIDFTTPEGGIHCISVNLTIIYTYILTMKYL